jgi:hypothetical protein
MADEIEQYPWETWSPETKERMKKAVGILDGVLSERAGRNLGVGQNYRKDSDAIAGAGGLPAETVTLLARYKQFLDTTQDDPNWQGPLQINNGPYREAVDTPADIEARNEMFYAGAEGRKQAVAQAANKNYREQEGRYDSVANPKDLAELKARKPPPPPVPALERQQAPIKLEGSKLDKAEPVNEIDKNIARTLLKMMQGAFGK